MYLILTEIYLFIICLFYIKGKTINEYWTLLNVMQAEILIGKHTDAAIYFAIKKKMGQWLFREINRSIYTSESKYS